MQSAHMILLTYYLMGLVLGQNIEAVPTTTSTLSATHGYQPKELSSAFVPHTAYLNSNSYVDGLPYGTPNSGANYPSERPGYFTGLMPSAHSALEIALWVFAKIGTLLVGGVALLVVGGLFTSIVCHLTPLCTLTFHGLEGLDKDAMRTLINPERISTAAALVQDAIGKYNRMQREIRN